MGTVISLDAARACRRINQFDDTIDRFERIREEAAASVAAMRNARSNYVSSLVAAVRHEVVTLLIKVDENLVGF